MKNSLFLLYIILFYFSCSKNDSDRVDDNFYLRNDGADMPVYVEGNLNSNTFIIILHGGPGGNAHIYNSGIPQFSDRMEEEFVMVYYDQRGSGTSQGHYSRKDLTINKHTEDLDLLIELLKDKYGSTINIFLLGHSWGGTLGTAYLLQRNKNNKISGWIEVDGAHNFIGTEEIIENFKRIGNEQINAGNSKSFWEEVINYCNDVNLDGISPTNTSKLNRYGFKAESTLLNDNVIDYNFRVGLGEFISEQAKYYFFSPYDAMTSSINLFFTSSGFGMFDEVTNTDYTSKLQNITLPALIIWGKYDMVIPVELGEQAFNNLGSTNKQIIIFENSGHSPMIYDPEKFSQTVISFIKLHI